LNLLYSGGATCYPSPGAPPPGNFHQRTRGVRGSSRLEAPNEPPADFAGIHRPPDSSLHPASGSSRHLPGRSRPHQPPCQPRGVIASHASHPSSFDAHRTRHPHHPARYSSRPRTHGPSPISLAVVLLRSTLPPARSPSHALRLATQNIWDVVGRGRGSPGWSEAERRGPPSSRPGAEPNFGSERAAAC
jgi:hypothetical protein